MTRHQPRLLVVDDLPDAADSLAMLLRLWGYNPEVAYAGADALIVARRFRPHAALLDLQMPGMDGFRLAGLLRELPGLAGAPLIAVTGRADAACRARAVELGFARYFLKPVAPELLQRALAQIVGQARWPAPRVADARRLRAARLRRAPPSPAPSLVRLDVAAPARPEAGGGVI